MGKNVAEEEDADFGLVGLFSRLALARSIGVSARSDCDLSRMPAYHCVVEQDCLRSRITGGLRATISPRDPKTEL